VALFDLSHLRAFTGFPALKRLQAEVPILEDVGDPYGVTLDGSIVRTLRDSHAQLVDIRLSSS
jgi:hypothetical protein